MTLASYEAVSIPTVVAMTSPLRSAVASSARRAIRTSDDGRAVAWERAAASAAVIGRDAQGCPVHIRALCWPIVPNAWALLQQAWTAVYASRHSTSKDPAAAAASWIGERAPQLSSPFRDTQAEESSVAALLSRTPIQVGLGICRIGDDPVAAARQAWAECLGAYNEYLRLPGRSACSTVVTQGLDAGADEASTEALQRVRRRWSEHAWLQDLRLQFMRDDVAPLPLEAASVVAQSIIEHWAGAAGVRAVFDIALAKAARVPDCLKRAVKTGKRR